MPLDPHETNPLYVLGRLFSIVEKRRNDGSVDKRMDTLLRTPLAGLGKISADLAVHPARAEISAIMALIPPEGPPAGPMRVSEQGPFWMGYYHQQSAKRLAHAITPDVLSRIGEALYGSTWQTEMARDLGLGKGGEGDSSRVRQMLTERRRLAPGAAADLMARMRQRSADAKALAEEIEAAARAPRSEAPADSEVERAGATALDSTAHSTQDQD